MDKKKESISKEAIIAEYLTGTISYRGLEAKYGIPSSHPKSHTHLQFARANSTPKIAKEYVFANADGRKTTKT